MQNDIKLAHLDQTKPETRKERLDTCNSCTSFNKDDGRCNECGCIMWLKTTIPFATCPLGKW